MPETPRLAGLLREAETTINALKHSRERITLFVICGRSHASWHPECGFLAHDENLMRQLDSLTIQVDGVRKKLIDRRAVLRAEQARSPFVRPSALQVRIDYLTLLCNSVRGRNLQDFLTVYGTVPAELRSIPQLTSAAQSLTNIAQDDLHKAAGQFADKTGEKRGWPRWKQYYDMYIEERTSETWKAVSEILQRLLAESYTERRILESQYHSDQECRIETKLASQVAELDDAVAQSKAILIEVRVLLERENTAVEAVRRVLQGTRGVEYYVNRAGEPLDEADRSLALDWARDYEGSDYRVKAMESARSAELVALRIYRDLHGKADDLSILQEVDRSDSRWRSADIDAAGRRIDVKNARRSFSSPESYTEHCVKRFKSDEHGRQVIVSGFLSEYLKDRDVGTGEKVIWLGETTIEIIGRLRDQFNPSHLELDFPSTMPSRIPPWLFDYPSECYADRNRALQNIRSSSFILPRSGCSLGILALMDRVERPVPGEALAEEALALAHRIRSWTYPTRPLLFLHVLDRFCRSAQAGTPFPASALRELLFSTVSSDLPSCSGDTIPLAVLDPLKTVKELIVVLERISERCSSRAAGFTKFKLTGPGVFRGQREDGHWQTIIAYCGGWRKLPDGQPVKCGKCPLVIDVDPPCEDPCCGRLVCQKCGYCKEDCTRRVLRQKMWPVRK